MICFVCLFFELFDFGKKELLCICNFIRREGEVKWEYEKKSGVSSALHLYVTAAILQGV